MTRLVRNCFECDRPADHMHHVVPRSRGGTRTIPLCGECHGMVHERTFNSHRYLTQEALRVKRARGECVSGAAPFGYRFEAGRVVADDAEQRVITIVHRCRAEGLTLRAIADRLAANGILPRNGGAWRIATLHKIVKVNK